jgi:dynein heavy chain
LKVDVKKFVTIIKDFRKDYEENGPMVDNIAPKEAIERLKRFGEECYVKNNTYEI